MGYYSNLAVVIVEQYESGVSIEQIAERMDLSYTEVASIVDAYTEYNGECNDECY